MELVLLETHHVRQSVDDMLVRAEGGDVLSDLEVEPITNQIVFVTDWCEEFSNVESRHELDQ